MRPDQVRPGSIPTEAMRVHAARPVPQPVHAATPIEAQDPGRQALGAFFAAQGVPRGPEGTALFELFTNGSLGPQAAGQLAAAGVTLQDLRRAAYDMSDAFNSLGAAGAAMARTATDVLVDANTLGDLTDGPATRQVVAEMLPRHLGEAIAAGQPPEIANAAQEFLLTGTLSQPTYDALGSGGIGDLAKLLGSQQGALAPALDGWGKEALGDATTALGQAAAAPGGYQGFKSAFVDAVPPEKRPYFERQAQAHSDGTTTVGPATLAGHAEANAGVTADAGADGSVGVENGGVVARGRAEAIATADAHAEADGKIDSPIGTTQGHAQADAHGEAWAGANGTARADANGITVNGRVGAGAKAEAKAQADVSHEVVPGLLGADAHGEAYARAEAAAYAQIDGNVGFDKSGNVEAYAGVDAKAVAEVEAGAKGAATVNLFGFKIIAGGYETAKAGFGAEAKAGAGYKDGQFFADASAGAAADAGAEQGGFVSVELPSWARGIVNGVAKLPGGPEAIGAAGQALSAIVQATHIGQGAPAAQDGPPQA